MLSVVTWKWRPREDYRSTYGPETVNILRRMVLRHYPHPHRFICVTDDPAGIDPRVEIVPIWDQWAEVPHPQGAKKNPSCYRRLKAFDPAMSAVFGRRFVSLDLDCVIVDDVTPVWERKDDFVCWGGTHITTTYNGSMVLMNAGARPQVWRDFDPQSSPRIARNAGHYGSDQGWMSYCLGPKEPRWNQSDGVYSYRLDVRHLGCLPPNARIIFFNGRIDPWSREAQGLEWVQRHYR